MNIQIRLATEADWSFIRSAIIALQDTEHALHDSRPTGLEVIDSYTPWLRNAITDNNGALFIAQADNISIGYVACFIVQDDNPAETADSNRYGLVQDICVLPDFRGKDIASHLLAAAERHLASHSISRLRICALEKNDSAIRAYRKYGFEDYEVVFEKRIITKVVS